MTRKILTLITGFIGIALIWIYSNFLTALGVFLFVWGHNIQFHWDDKKEGK